MACARDLLRCCGANPQSLLSSQSANELNSATAELGAHPRTIDDDNDEEFWTTLTAGRATQEGIAADQYRDEWPATKQQPSSITTRLLYWLVLSGAWRAHTELAKYGAQWDHVRKKTIKTLNEGSIRNITQNFTVPLLIMSHYSYGTFYCFVWILMLLNFHTKIKLPWEERGFKKHRKSTT